MQNNLHSCADFWFCLLCALSFGYDVCTACAARQLRELAVINGTLRDEIICRLCGQRSYTAANTQGDCHDCAGCFPWAHGCCLGLFLCAAGHRQLECPQRNQSWQAANIRCAICSSDLHPSADCPQRHTRTAEQATREMDSEYSDFMNEISGGGPVATRSAQPLYITDGGATGGQSSQGGGQYAPGGGSGGNGPSAPSSSSGPPPQSGGYSGDHRGGHSGGSYQSGSRFVKSADPRETFREFRPANAAAITASAALPAVSHRDGFSSSGPQQGGGYGQQQHQQYGGGPPQRYPPQQHHYAPGPPAGQSGGPAYGAYPPPQQYGPPGGYSRGPPPPPQYGRGPPSGWQGQQQQWQPPPPGY